VILRNVLEPFKPEKVVLVAVTKYGIQYVFSREQFNRRLIGNLAVRRFYESAQGAAQRLIASVSPCNTSPFVVLRWKSLGPVLHCVVWFPEPYEFDRHSFVGNIMEIDDLHVTRHSGLLREAINDARRLLAARQAAAA